MFSFNEAADVFRFGENDKFQELAKDLSVKQDSSLVEPLLEILELVRSDQNSGKFKYTDASEERRLQSLEQAIVSLLSVEDARQLLDSGQLKIGWFIERWENCKTLDEYWGYLR